MSAAFRRCNSRLWLNMPQIRSFQEESFTSISIFTLDWLDCCSILNVCCKSGGVPKFQSTSSGSFWPAGWFACLSASQLSSFPTFAVTLLTCPSFLGKYPVLPTFIDFHGLRVPNNVSWSIPMLSMFVFWNWLVFPSLLPLNNFYADRKKNLPKWYHSGNKLMLH